jgi:hypothetical protein
MRFDGWKLGYIEVWWLGVFIAPTTKMTIGEGFCRMAHRTVRCASHVTRPLGFDRWSFWQRATGQPGGAPDSHYSLSGAPSCACYDFCARSRHYSLFSIALQTTVGADDCCSAWHTRQSGATPDSPMNYSGPASPNSRRWQVWSRTPWCTGHCPVRQTRATFGLSFALFIWTLSWTFYWFVLNLWHM